jgi:hypothetical protein
MGRGARERGHCIARVCDHCRQDTLMLTMPAARTLTLRAFTDGRGERRALLLKAGVEFGPPRLAFDPVQTTLIPTELSNEELSCELRTSSEDGDESSGRSF